MVKEALVMLRVHAEEKDRIEAAARAAGRSVTDLILEAVMKEVAKIEKADGPKPTRRGHLPTYFRASCLTASAGGTQSYRWVGRSLVGALASERPLEIEEDDWCQRLEELEQLLALDDSDDDVITWFKENLPRFIAQVPPRRRGVFIEGLREGCEEAGIPI